jgi:hypothetical protein
MAYCEFKGNDARLKAAATNSKATSTVKGWEG